MLNEIVNYISASTKRHSELILTRKYEIQELIMDGELETGTGANQTCTLQRSGTTRWSSYYNYVRSLIELFGTIQSFLSEIDENDPNQQFRSKAYKYLVAMTSFEFVFILLLLNKVMGITDFICQALQRKNQDIVNALNYVSHSKYQLQNLRDGGWDDLFEDIVSFCERYNIEVPDMSAPHKHGTGCSCQQRDSITVKHHYRVEIFNDVIDFQLMELNNRFPENTMELLYLSLALDPSHAFRSFNVDDICNLAEKFYPEDFTYSDLYALRIQLGYYKLSMDRSDFQNIDSISTLYRRLVETCLAEDFYLISRLIRLVLTLPVSTSTTERAFSSMKFIKNRLRNKIENEFLTDCMIIYIERDFASSIDNDSIVDEFYSMKKRRMQLK